MNAWLNHRGLWFGRMHEDWAIEASLFAPHSRVFCIASAGDTALALAARGHEVTAVDVNPAQVHYLSARLDGMPMRGGRVDRLLGAVRRAATFMVGRERVEGFLSMTDPAAQVAWFDQHLDSAPLRCALNALTDPRALRCVYRRAQVAAIPPRFGRVLRDRFRKGFARHPNRHNPWAWRLLAGRESPQLLTPPDPRRLRVRPRVGCADAAEYLLSQPAGAFDALTLSNILDGTTHSEQARLFDAVRHAAAPGAWVVLRSFGEPRSADEARWALRDRSMFWGRIAVTHMNLHLRERSDEDAISTETTPAGYRRRPGARAGADLCGSARRA